MGCASLDGCGGCLDLGVTFRGDRRVLGDLQLLAANDYGEDAFGNNIALPAELSYLRR